MSKELEMLEAQLTELRARKEMNPNLTADELRAINGRIWGKTFAISRYKRLHSCPDMHRN